MHDCLRVCLTALIAASCTTHAREPATSASAPSLPLSASPQLPREDVTFTSPPEPPPFSAPALDPTAAAASSTPSDADLAKKLSNPVASLISVPIQFNYDTGYGPKDADRVVANIQPVIPISLNEDLNLIVRTIVPIIYQGSLADFIDSEFGLGDTVQSFFFSPKEPVGGWILAAGPVALWPTGTEPAIRSEQFGLGPTVLALRQDHGWTYGMLANHIWGVTNSDDHPDVNATFLQPFISYTWPTATTLAFNTEATYDWTGEEWTVPLNVIASQMVKIGSQPMQFSLGGRYYADAPDSGPEWGIRFVVTFLFPK